MPETPSVRARSANLTSVSVIASSALRTAPGRSRRSAVRRPPDAAPEAPPLPDRIPAGGRDLEEVRPISLVEAQGGLGQASRIPIDLGKVPPHGVGDAVHGLVVDGGEHALAPAHGLHVESAP